MLQGIRKYLVIAILALMLVFNGCASHMPSLPQPTFTPLPTHDLSLGGPIVIGPEEALRMAAETYAETYGITLEEAFTRLQYQDEISGLNVSLQQNEADTFGGLWIEHEPEYKIVVLFTSWGSWRIRPYLKNVPFADRVEVRGCRYPLAELEAIYFRALEALDRLEFKVSARLDVTSNRVQVIVSDRKWFESELQRVGVQLPSEVELVVIEGGMRAKDRELLLTPPVPGIVFPRQMPAVGLVACPAALLIGELRLEDGCLYVYPLWGGERLLPIWPPDFTLSMDSGQVLVINGQGEVVARSGEEVYMGGGNIPGSDWISQQIPSSCSALYFDACGGARFNLPAQPLLYTRETLAFQQYKAFFLRYTPVLDAQVNEPITITGELTWSETHRCLHARNERGSITILWPPDWSVKEESGTLEIKDAAGEVMARLGEGLQLSGRAIPLEWENPLYHQLFYELPGDCTGTTWMVDGR